MEQGSNNSIHPRKILYILLMLQAFLLLIVLLVPSGEWKWNESNSLHFISLNELVNGKQVEHKDISTLVKTVVVDTATNEEATVEPVAGREIKLPTDTLTDFPLQHAGKNGLEMFFSALDSCTQNAQPIAIAYYGDSQIEGDRFSDYLRNKMQKQFGGGGPGMVTPIDISHMRITIRQEESKEWVKLASFGYPQAKVESGRYGISGAVYRYRNGYYVTKQTIKDSTTKDTITEKYWVSSNSNPWLSFKRSNLSYASVRRYNRAGIWYSSTHAVALRVGMNGKTETDTLPPSKNGLYSWPVPDTVEQLRLTFTGAESPDVYGVSLDRPEGVRIDNFSMRGSSGTDFTRMNGAFLAEQHRQRGTRLIILQYGVNVVPYVKDSVAVQYYEYSFLKQLQLLKRQLPDVSILVVGTTDLATKSGTDYVTYPFLEQIRDAQRRAAFATGCAFWDAYEAMGGKNAMASWVFHDPPLAAKDFTHLSSKGANILAELLHKALMRDYAAYARKKKMLPG